MCLSHLISLMCLHHQSALTLSVCIIVLPCVICVCIALHEILLVETLGGSPGSLAPDLWSTGSGQSDPVLHRSCAVGDRSL